MSKKRFFLAAVLAAGIGLTTTAYQAPPLLLVEDEDGVVEQPAQTISAKESNPADQRKTAKSAPAPSTAQGGLVLIDEEENTQVQDDRKAEETRLEQERIEAEKRAEEVRLTAEKKAKAEADKKAKEEAVRIEKARQDSIKAAQEEAKRIEKARQDSIKAAKAEAIRIEKMRQDSIRAARQDSIRIEKARQDSIEQAQEAERIRIEKARQDSIEQAQEAERIRIEQARQDSIEQAQETERIRIEKARQDSIDQAQEAERIRIEKARQDSIEQAQEAERIRIEQARQDSIEQAQEAERVRIEKARQDSIEQAQEAERIRIEKARQDSIEQAQEAERVRIEKARQDSIEQAQEAERIRIEQARLDSIRVAQEEAIREKARQDSILRIAQELMPRNIDIEKVPQDHPIHNAQKENEKQKEDVGKQPNAAVQVYVAPSASAPAQNTQSDDLNSKMLEAVQRAYEEALKQANKSDSIRLVQWQLEQELKKLKEQQAAQEAQKQKEKEEKEAAEQAAALAAQAAAQQEAANAQPEKETVFTRYYKHSGRNMLSILSIGYSTYFQVGSAVAAGASPTGDAFRRHLLNVELFEWRAKCFGMQMFNFEMELNTPFVSEENPEQNRYLFERGGENADERVEATAKTMWFAYKPAVKFYIPCTKWLAIELYGGAEVDLTKMWSKINSTYYTGYHNETNQDGLRIPEQNSFVGVYGGAGFMLTAVPQVPLEIKAEYRHPVKGNTALVPQGVYISAQLHLASPIKK